MKKIDEGLELLWLADVSNRALHQAGHPRSMRTNPGPSYYGDDHVLETQITHT